jgi:hypothetical protein
LTVQWDAGYVWIMPARLRDLARVAQAPGQSERAARLRGAGEAMTLDEAVAYALEADGGDA